MNNLDEFVEEKWIFSGFRYVNGKLRDVWLPVIGDVPEQNDYRIFDRQKTSRTVGMVYKVPVRRSGDVVSIDAAGITLDGIWENDELVLRLKALHQCALEEDRNARLEKKYRRLELPDSLSEIKVLYNKLPYAQRITFESILLANLRKR